VQILIFFSIILFLDILDSEKTEAQRDTEKLLIEKLVSIVNKKDELVQDLDNQEKA